MDRLLYHARRLALVGAWCGGALVVLASALIGVDVLVRGLFALSIGGASELSGYVLAISSSWSFALVMLDRGHIRIDSLYAVLPTRVCAVLDVLSLLTMLGLAVMLAWQGWIVYEQSFHLGSRALTPIATKLEYPQFLWVVGLVYFALIVALLLARALLALAVGDIATVRRIAGSRTAAQDLQEELESLHARRAGA
jgi:TRAP-type C4-dicarboxylate transport system permease small subunit